jgi:oxygen-dependent protoporphyrinogen oxidase
MFSYDPNVNIDEYTKNSIKNIEKILGISSHRLLKHDSHINLKCIPQYQLGHSDLLDQINLLIKQRGWNLSLLGASYLGVSVNDCVFYSRKLASQFAKSKFPTGVFKE